ncbi:hypothetical protein LOK74_15565 [Brevibacillus humidisoli]|uniref:hypothetical protein n=1 Tax=Brevibacillus humidisoli TaxID=2895522 RepID=UPI001E60DD40|nr:hypothetical protein [Brevibacillus humidisoli]UFJ39467.1 hypothetical protein LOK74_15565 [Brevibacillus humidisoli]
MEEKQKAEELSLPDFAELNDRLIVEHSPGPFFRMRTNLDEQQDDTSKAVGEAARPSVDVAAPAVDTVRSSPDAAKPAEDAVDYPQTSATEEMTQYFGDEAE